MVPTHSNSPPPDGSSGHTVVRLFRQRDYRLFIVSIVLGGLANSAQGVAVGWEIYERTGSALALGWVGFAQFLPIALFFLPAGQIADRHERRYVMAASHLLWAIACVILIASTLRGGSVAWLYLALACTGFASLLYRAARDALLPALVPSQQLAEAMAWNSSSYQMASMAGPAIAGALIAWFKSAAVVYSVNFALICTTIVLALLIHHHTAARIARVRSWQDLFGGITHVWREKLVLGLVTIDLFSTLLGGAVALMPIFAKDVLRTGPEGLGLLSAGPAIGAFAMALLQGFRRPYRRAGPAFFAAIGTFAIATIVFGLSSWFWVSFAALVIAGGADNIGVVIRQTLVQLHTPDELRGRVSAVNRVLISASNELGALRAGALAAFVGPVVTVAAGGVVTVLVLAAGYRLFPMLRRLEGFGAPPR